MGLLDDAIREHLDLKRRSGADPAEVQRAEQEALGPVRRAPVPSEPVDFPDHEATPAAAPERLVIGHDDWDDEPEADEVAPPRSGGGRGFFRRRSAREPEPDVVDDMAIDPARVERAAPQPRPADEDDDLFADEREDDDPFGDDVLSGPVGDEADPPSARPQASGPEPPAATADPLRSPEPPAAAAGPPPVELTPLPGAVERPAEPAPPAQSAPPLQIDPTRPVPREELLGETVEYDVEQAFAAGADEDVLEETPEFLQDTPDHDRLWFEQRPPRDFDFDG